MSDLLIRLAFILAGSAALTAALASAFAPRLLFVTLRFIVGAIEVSAAVALLITAAIFGGLAFHCAHMRL
jgi:hypothetical protein